MPQPKGDWVMLLTRKAWYGLIAVKHLAEQPPQNSFSAKDLANSYGFPQEALAKILQGLARAGLLLSHHGIKGGYTLVRDHDQISVLDVIMASEGGPRRSSNSNNSLSMRCVGLRSWTSTTKPASPPIVTMLGAAEARAEERRWISADLSGRVW